MKKITLTAGGMFLLSIIVKAAGVFREGYIANTFGASAATDRYLFVFSIVTLAMLVFGTSFNHLFLPYYQARNHTSMHRSDDEAAELINTLFAGSCLVAVIIGAGAFIAYKYQFDHRLTLLIAVFALGFPFLLLNVFLDTLLQAKNKYYLSAAVKILPIIGSIGSAFIFHHSLGLISVATGFIMGSFIACVLQGVQLIFCGIHVRRHFLPLSSYPIATWLLAGQTLISVLAGPVNVVIDRFFAGFLPAGSVTYLNNASLVAGLPIGLIGTILETLYFSAITTNLNDRGVLINVVQRGLSTAQLLFLPIMIGFMFIGRDVIRLIYQHGAFQAADTAHTTMILFGYLPLVWFQGLQLVLSKTVYALKAGNHLFQLSLWMVGLNTLLDWLFFPIFGAPGLAFASSFVAFFYLMGTLRLLSPYVDMSGLQLLWRSAAPTFLPCVMMIAAGLFLKYGIHFVGSQHLVFGFFCFVFICGTIYFGALYCFAPQFVKSLFRVGGARR